VVHFLHWIFRQHVFFIVLTAAFVFFVVTMSFALMIWIASNRRPYCISGVEYEVKLFTDAFSLSWQTFSSVVSRFVARAF
jgi:hypothetical protein